MLSMSKSQEIPTKSPAAYLALAKNALGTCTCGFLRAVYGKNDIGGGGRTLQVA